MMDDIGMLFVLEPEVDLIIEKNLKRKIPFSKCFNLLKHSKSKKILLYK